MQLLLESVLFEPRAWAAHPPPIDAVPLAPAQRAAALATPRGLLLHEMTHTPEAVLHPLLRLCRGALRMCAGTGGDARAAARDYAAAFPQLLLYVTRLAVRVEAFAIFARESPATAARCVELRRLQLGPLASLVLVYTNF